MATNAAMLCADGKHPRVSTNMFSTNTEMRLYAQGGARLYINEKERCRFLAAARQSAPPVRTLCLVLVYTGCRVSEALALTPASVQRETATIAIHSLKKRRSGVIREVPVPATLITLLDEDHRLAASATDSEEVLFPMCRSTAWRQIKQVMARAEAEGPQATAKGLRHGFGVHALHSGVPLNLVQKWMGHASIAVTAIYGNAVGPEERIIAERMW